MWSNAVRCAQTYSHLVRLENNVINLVPLYAMYIDVNQSIFGSTLIIESLCIVTSAREMGRQSHYYRFCRSNIDILHTVLSIVAYLITQF